METARILDFPKRAPDGALYARNIENFWGLATVPVGIAGPLVVRGTAAVGSYRVPLATTEAALVASYNRGTRVISEAGGCNAAVIDERLERTPAFVLSDLPGAMAFAAWIEAHASDLRAAAQATSRHARCIGIEPVVEGNHVYLACAYRTGEAAGHMVTIATDALCAHVREHAPFEIRRSFVEANLSGDKKASARSFTRTRGRRVSADVTVPRALVAKRLHVEPWALAEYWRIGAVGAAMSGAIGLQGHYANGLSALALATGQDVACVAESATGITRFECDDRGDLYAAVTLPNLVVGTVGGGTHLPTQRAALDVIAGGRPLGAAALAEIAAALVLAGELSICGALCANEFSAAHERLASGGTHR